MLGAFRGPRAIAAKSQDHKLPNVTPPTRVKASSQLLGTPVRGTLKSALATLVLLLLAMLFLGERPSGRDWAGIVLILSGVGLLVLKR